MATEKPKPNPQHAPQHPNVAKQEYSKEEVAAIVAANEAAAAAGKSLPSILDLGQHLACLTRAEAALVAEFDEREAERSELADWLAETTPRTPEGVQAKARAALIYVEGDGVTLGLVLSLLQDVAGEARA